MPNFFRYAKDYTPEQTVPNNHSFVNKLERIIKNKRLSFKNIADFDYRNLMHDPYIQIDQRLIESYIELNKSYHYKINSDFNMTYISQTVKKEFSKYGYSDIEIADMLVEFLYHKIDSCHKRLLWLCYGDVLLENLKLNLANIEGYCIKCGIRFKKGKTNHKYCNHCYLEKLKKDDERIVICKDCGTEFIVSKKVRNKSRCEYCQEVHIREYEREKKRKQREKKHAE